PSPFEVNSPLKVSWNAGARFPTRSPVYVIVAATGAFRADVREPAENNKKQQLPNPGIIAIPGGTRGPLGIAFGDNSNSRIFIPSYQPGSNISGSFALRLLTTGTQSIRSGLVSFTSCGERLLKSFKEDRVLVNPGRPELVIQDFYDTSTPLRSLLSTSG